MDRYGNNVVARTNLGRAERVVLAGHIDTVPIADNVPSRLDEDGVLWGCGTSDMKSGVAVQLRIAATVPEPNRDLTFVFYDNEEVAAHLNGLGGSGRGPPRLAGGRLRRPAGAAPTARSRAAARAPCASILTTKGERAHSARSWMGSNAVHKAAPILDRLAAYEPRARRSTDSGYHEGLNAVRIEGGVASNVIPDACSVTVNFRYAPDRSAEEAVAFVRDFFAGCDIDDYVVDDHTGGALPRPRPPGRRRVHGGRRRQGPRPSSAGRTSPGSARSASPP